MRVLHNLSPVFRMRSLPTARSGLIKLSTHCKLCGSAKRKSFDIGESFVGRAGRNFHDSSGTTAGTCRRARRVTWLSGGTRFHEPENGAPLPAILVDVARNDVLILTDRPLRFGTALQMVIYCDLITAISYTRGTVHSCRATSRGWEIGVFLSQTLPMRLTSRAFDDLRGHLRYECDWKAWILWKTTGCLIPFASSTTASAVCESE